MNKKIIFIAVLLIAGVFALFMFFKPSQEKVEVLAETTVAVRNDLPNIPITTLDGTQLTTRNLKGKTILVFFQPQCDHCQREADQISKNLEEFKEFNMYFISSDNIPALEKFSRDYNLAGNANIHFTRTEGDHILKNLGPIETPSLYIYTAQGQLVKAFNGETPIEQILQYL